MSMHRSNFSATSSQEMEPYDQSSEIRLLVDLERLQQLITGLAAFLVEHRIQAEIWLKSIEKLSDWQPWLTYLNQGLVSKFYGVNLPANIQAHLQVGPATSSTPENTFHCGETIALELEPGSNLRHIYFVVVLSPQFLCLISARPQHPAKPDATHPEQLTKTLYQLQYSFEAAAIGQMLSEIQQAIAVGDQTPVELLMRSPLPLPDPPIIHPDLLKCLLLKQLQHNLERSVAESEQAVIAQSNQKLNHTLAMKADLLGHFVAELGPPLTNIKTALSLLQSPQLKREQRQRYLDLLQQEWERQNVLIQGLLEWQQFEQHLGEPTESKAQLEEILPSLVSTFQPLAAEQGITLGYTLPPTGCPAIACPAPWLRQIIQNLIHNSLNVTPPEGRIMIRARVQAAHLELVVSDTGQGIESQVLPHIFESFYRSDSTNSQHGNSAGLGLTLVRYLLDRCQGSIQVSSQVGKGSVFTLMLPFHRADQSI